MADRWDAAFDWDNDKCDEVIFGFPGAKGYSHWHYDGDTYAWTVPAKAFMFFDDSKSGVGHNTKYAASPSYDLNGDLYDYELGMPIQNFRKYPGDYRMINYRYLGDSRREGLFLYGYVEYTDESTGTQNVSRHLKCPTTSTSVTLWANSSHWLPTNGLLTRAAHCATVTITQDGIL